MWWYCIYIPLFSEVWGECPPSPERTKLGHVQSCDPEPFLSVGPATLFPNRLQACQVSGVHNNHIFIWQALTTTSDIWQDFGEMLANATGSGAQLQNTLLS